MKALVINDGRLELEERPTPEPHADQVLVEVAGAGVIAVLAPKGRVIVVGLIAGAQARLDLARLLRNRSSVTGTVLPRPPSTGRRRPWRASSEKSCRCSPRVC